jgi:DNA-binding MarR family transcriptional regulator
VSKQIAHNLSQRQAIGPLLRRVSRLANRFYRSQLKELGLTARQAAAIVALKAEPSMTLGRLAEMLGSDRATASILVDRLLSADLVARVTDAADRRRVQLFPTEKALQLAEQLEPTREATERLIEDALGEQDAQTLRVLLARLDASLEHDEALLEAAIAPFGR